MLIRHPDPGCPLCESPVALRGEELWRSWCQDGAAQWARTNGIDVAQVRRHLHSHGALQPPPAHRLVRERALARVAALPPRAQMVLDALHRGRVMTAEQVGYIVIGPDSGAPRAARRLLEQMATLDLVYGYWPKRAVERGRRAPQPVWMLGRDATPWIEHVFSQSLWPGSWASSPNDVREELLRHDVGANRILASIAREIRSAHHIAGVGEVIGAVDPRNWWGSRHLGIGLIDPQTHQPVTMRPDGFAALSLMACDPHAPHASLLLPFFLEYDRGSRTLDDVADQLLTYHALARSTAAARRFPALDVPDLRVPVLMVFSKASRRRAIDARLEGVDRTGIITADESDVLRRGALDEPVAYRAGDTPENLLWALCDELRALHRQRRVHAHTVLVLDRSGARARRAGFAAAIAPSRGGRVDTVEGVQPERGPA